MMNKEINNAIEILREKDKDYIRKVLKREKNEITYDCDYSGWCVKDQYAVDYLYNDETTYLNPKELESVVDEIIEEEIFPVKESALMFIENMKLKWGLNSFYTESDIESKVLSDTDFSMFSHMGLVDEVIKQLKKQGVEIK